MAPKKRPCKICRRWFEPHPRAGDRQRVCSKPACQQERHRRADRAWHGRNPDYDRKRRLRERLGDEPEPAEPDPLDELDWRAAEEAVGPAHRVVIERAVRLLIAWAQDAVASREEFAPEDLRRLPADRAQDAVASKGQVVAVHPARLPLPTPKMQSDSGGPGP